MPDWIELTRDQLYELAWQKPMSRLAAEYSISGVGLAKLCARHTIPTPPRGYWALLAVGRAPSKPKLPSLKNAPTIRIQGGKPFAPKIKDELSISIQAERQPTRRIVVSERLQAPIPLVAQARDALHVAKEDDVGLVLPPPGFLAVCVSRTRLPRALRIADALLKSFEARGWTVAISDRSTLVSVDTSLVTIGIEEILETEERPDKPDLDSGYYGFHYNRTSTVRKPSGRLMIVIHEKEVLWNHTQQRKWRDSEKHMLEDQLNDVVVGLLKLSTALKVDRTRRELEAQAAEERGRKVQAALDEQDRLRKALAREKAAVQLLLDQSVRWRRSQDLRHLVQAARERGRLEESQLEGQVLEDWARWALQQADRLDPLIPSPPSILDDAGRIEHMCDGLEGRR
jgi:hypothetical protein